MLDVIITSSKKYYPPEFNAQLLKTVFETSIVDHLGLAPYSLPPTTKFAPKVPIANPNEL